MTPLTCDRVREALPELLDGEAPAGAEEHLADCDACRDARHDAERTRELAREAGEDYRVPDDLEGRLLAGLDARHAGPVTAAVTSGVKVIAAAHTAGGGTSPGARPAPWLRWLRRPRNTLVAGLTGAAAAAALVSLFVGEVAVPGAVGTPAAATPWSGTVDTVNRAGGGDGLVLCDANGEGCAPAHSGEVVAAGRLLRTDDRTRVHLQLTDGTRLSLDRSTELVLTADRTRHASLVRGALVADVEPVEGSTAEIGLPRGRVEVLGTKLAVRATDGAVAVDVSRGSVRLVDEADRAVTVRAGEEGRSYPGTAPYAMGAPSLGSALSWSESSTEEDASSARGLGELVAKKPGDERERDGAVTLTSHRVKTRIVDSFARTEIEEVFTNQTDDVLEGIYRFPLPPDAQIERLALEVDDHFEEGAFVDRDRAAAIWRGAIVNSQRRPAALREEIIWVPGPWKDPALLEWQRGGRFELRIFPIPKKGSRKIVLTYTQVVQPTGQARRYTYPLAHDPSGSSKVGSFHADIEVRGHDAAHGVRTVGYGLEARDEGGKHVLSMDRDAFVPSGDLVVEYALPGRAHALTSWTYRPSVGEDTTRIGGAEDGIDGDAPYVALSLRPELPRWTEDRQRGFVVVVDASRSMYGERHRRATALATQLVQELDRLDRFTVLACDTSCRRLDGGARVPGVQAAQDVQRFLEAITPEGGSDVGAALREAAAVGREDTSRALRVVYIGDGTPTVGAIRPKYVTEEIARHLPTDGAGVTAVAVGADADLDTLGAMARGGGGVVVPYTPGQRAVEVAYAILGASYGMGLRDVRLELPAGLSAPAPQALDTIVGGGEAMVTARMTAPHVTGTVVLRGTVAGQPFEQRYPVDLRADTTQGNAFVPRLRAALRIADLERDGSAKAREQAVALSGAFSVASRFTSLLVLESPAMFQAFGLDNRRSAPVWTGEEETSMDRVEAERKPDVAGGPDDVFAGPGLASKDVPMAPPAATFASPPPPPPPPAPMTAPEKKPSVTAREPVLEERAWRRPPPRMIPMRRIWERKGVVVTNRQAPAAASAEAIAKAEAALAGDANRRAAVKDLYRLYMLAGQVERAGELAEGWSARDALDPEALTARADVAARAGDRDLAIRILGSVVDVRPGDVPSQRRLARLHRWAGDAARGCRHAVAIAQLQHKDAELLAEALHCSRKLGETRLAQALYDDAEPATQRAADARLDKMRDQEGLLGELRVVATWAGGHDLDVALIDPNGMRVSWLGAPTKALITAEDVTSRQREGLALLGSLAGEYVLEVTRVNGEGPVSGQVQVLVAGTPRTVPFTLTGERAQIALIGVRWESRLVPL